MPGELGKPGEPGGGFGDAETTQLGKLIHYGVLFELESHQMQEVWRLQHENKKLRKDTRRQRARKRRRSGS